MKKKPETPNYRDSLFRAIMCLLAAHVILMMGRPNLRSVEAFLIPSYYPTLLINYGIALIVAFVVKKITLALDKRHDWYDDIWRRAILQFAFGVLGVSILSYLMVCIYFCSFGQDIRSSGYLDYELPFSIALITILNFYYVASYFYIVPRSKAIAAIKVTPDAVNQDLPEQDSIPDSMEESVNENLPIEPTELSASNTYKKEILIIDTPIRSIPIKVTDVIMFFIFQRTVFVRMKGVNSLNDCYQLHMTLTDLMQVLDEQIFFRISRQCIINIDAIGAYQILTVKSLMVTLLKEYGKLDNMEEKDWIKVTTVAEDRALDFKNWINR